MELGISTASYFPTYYTEDILEHIASLNADICEIFFASHSEYTPEFGKIIIDKLKKAKEIHPLKVHSIHALTNQFEPELFGIGKRAYLDAIQTYRNVLNVGQMVGAKYYTMHGATILKRAINYTFDYPKISERVNLLSDIANEYGIKLCYENVHWTYFHTPDYFANLKPLCPNIGTVLDIKQARQSQYDYKEYLKVMGNTLETVHVCDYNVDGITTIPGRGIFDFVELFKILLDKGFDGGVLMEVYSKNYKDENDLKESFDFLKVCLDKAKK